MTNLYNGGVHKFYHIYKNVTYRCGQSTYYEIFTFPLQYNENNVWKKSCFYAVFMGVSYYYPPSIMYVCVYHLTFLIFNALISYNFVYLTLINFWKYFSKLKRKIVWTFFRHDDFHSGVFRGIFYLSFRFCFRIEFSISRSMS